MNKTIEDSLERDCEIADAKLSVIEDLRWTVAMLAGAVVYLKWNSWILAIPVAIICFIFIARPYEKASEAAREAFEKATNTGRYWHPPKDAPQIKPLLRKFNAIEDQYMKLNIGLRLLITGQ